MPAPSPAQLDVELVADKPAIVRVDGVRDSSAWVSAQREVLRAVVAEHGAVLVRGLSLTDAGQVAAVFAGLATGPDALMVEREGFAARRDFGNGVYSSSTWPANQPMCMHHELSYRLEVPGTMLLACLRPAPEGGGTGLADAAAVLEALPSDLVDRFEREGWLLTRSYNDEIGASVAESFGTDDRDAVEAYCRAHGITVEWQPNGDLRTVQRRPAVVRHPRSGRRCWFNQVAFLNEHTLDPEVREFLLEVYGPEALPFTTFFGDGEPIGPDLVALLNETYDAHTVSEPWQAGDLLVIDNIRTAHSRAAYRGDREVLVGLTDAVRLAEVGA